MKKMLMMPLVLALCCGSAFAFNILSYPPPVRGSDLQIDIGVGFTGGGTLRIPPLEFNVEYALPANVPISLGGLVAFYQTGRRNDGWTYVTFGGRANWHWAFPVKWLDLYTGIFLGYRYANWEGTSIVSSGSGFAFGGQLGAHFYFTKTLGLVVEFGYPFLAKAGLAIKF
jgi:hypothetical protein